MLLHTFKCNTVLVQSDDTFMILGYINVLVILIHMRNFKMVIPTAWKKKGHTLEQKLLKISHVNILTGR